MRVYVCVCVCVCVCVTCCGVHISGWDSLWYVDLLSKLVLTKHAQRATHCHIGNFANSRLKLERNGKIIC